MWHVFFKANRELHLSLTFLWRQKKLSDGGVDPWRQKIPSSSNVITPENNPPLPNKVFDFAVVSLKFVLLVVC